MPKKVAFYLSSMRKGGAERVIANLTEYFYHKNYQELQENIGTCAGRAGRRKTWKFEEKAPEA